MAKKVIIQLYPRNKYPSTVAGKTYYPRERKKLGTMVGGADEMWVHTRVFARDASVTLNFTILHGCQGDEPPGEGPRMFPLSASNISPNLPYDGTSMTALPDDGSFSVNPKMGLADIQAFAAGAVGSIEFESWATLIYND